MEPYLTGGGSAPRGSPVPVEGEEVAGSPFRLRREVLVGEGGVCLTSPLLGRGADDDPDDSTRHRSTKAVFDDVVPSRAADGGGSRVPGGRDSGRRRRPAPVLSSRDPTHPGSSSTSRPGVPSRVRSTGGLRRLQDGLGGGGAVTDTLPQDSKDVNSGSVSVPETPDVRPVLGSWLRPARDGPCRGEGTSHTPSSLNLGL